ncbi:MAG: N,N-dimethylformamidase beta subunit family domain-containing protein, partial [Thermoanaerobaculia bacterium]
MRAFLLSLALVALVIQSAEGQRRRAVTPPRPVTQLPYTQGGYADRLSVEQGGAIAFHIASNASPFTLEIVNLADPDTVLWSVPGLTTAARDCTGLQETGCGWPVTTTVDIPLNWPSGYYAARFPRTSGGYRYVFFVVRTAVPASQAPMLVIVSTHTWQAYNAFGGRSAYPSSAPSRAHRLSFDRPLLDADGLGRFDRWDKPFMQWLEGENIPYEVATDHDLEDPTLLPHYELIVFVGHSEYWTATARANVEAYSTGGGHIAVLGGNTMWWQARLEDNGRTFVAYKDAKLDPESGHNNVVVTVNWFNEPVLRPENLLFGASFRNGGFVNENEPTVPFTVTDVSQWVFSGTDVQPGSQFGAISAGWETDGALFNCNADGLAAAVDGSDGAPLNFQVLATVPATAGYGTVGMYTNQAGAVVFNAGSQNWVRGLGSDHVVQRVTANVIRRLSTGERFPYMPVASSDRMRDEFNCAMPAEQVLPGWRGTEAQ